MIRTQKDIGKELEEEETKVARINMAEEPFLEGQTGGSGNCEEPEIAEADVHSPVGANGAGLQGKSSRLYSGRSLNCEDK